MFGKNKCKILKEIRQKIADENDIPFVTRECSYQGECSGTCPKCEQELRYLEQQLYRRQRLGKAVVVTALCAGMSLGVTACDPKDKKSASPEPSTATGAGVQEVKPGVLPNDPELIDELEGEPTEIPSEFYTELEGDVAYTPDAEAATGDKITSDSSSGNKTPVPTESEGYDPTEGLPIVLPPDEFGD